MILKCPNCGEQYEIRSRGELEGFTMKCQSCGTEISAAENNLEIDEEKEVSAEDSILGEGGTVYVKEKNSFGCIWQILLSILIFALLVSTKPGKMKHVREIGLELMSDKMQSENSLTQGLAFLLGPTVMDLFLAGGLQIDDYVIFNVGRIKFQDIDKPVTIGVFNNVIPLTHLKKKDQHTSSE